MSQVVLDITMSLDGFVTAPNDGPGRGLGDDGECLHYWVSVGRGHTEKLTRSGRGPREWTAR
jgi:hypothetical protein